MAINPANAIGAYNSAIQRLGKGAGAPDAGDTTAPAGATDFGSMLKKFAEDAIATGKTSEKQSIAAAAGKADINQVVEAVAEAELTLNAVTAVRDKVIQAYQTIIRMPI